MSESHATAYADLRIRVSEMIDRTDASALGKPAPATPEWCVHDVIAHLVGVPDDVVHGRLDGLASDQWTQTQVDKRRDVAAADLLAEWAEQSPAFEAMLAGAPAEIAGQALFDAATHEYDIRHALGVPGARNSEAIVVGWEWIVAPRTRGAMPGLCFVVDGEEQIAGAGEVVARIEAPRFELFRAVSGRRSAKEIAQYKWDRDPEPELLLAAAFFRLRDDPLGE